MNMNCQLDSRVLYMSRVVFRLKMVAFKRYAPPTQPNPLPPKKNKQTKNNKQTNKQKNNVLKNEEKKKKLLSDKFLK